jgi:hypothetical protein
MLSLGVLVAALATVSYAAQFRTVLAAKGSVLAAALEAAILDVAALISATLGVALALHGRRAIRARALNVTALATSVVMNVLAAARCARHADRTSRAGHAQARPRGVETVHAWLAELWPHDEYTAIVAQERRHDWQPGRQGWR